MLAFKVDPYASGVLRKDVHSRIVADIDNISRDAAIQPHWISRPLAETCTAGEVEWVRRFRFHALEGKSGLCLTGPFNQVENRMAAIAGALVRNFIRARVMTVSQLIDVLDQGTMPELSCLLLPNFFIGKSKGGSVPPWKVSLLHDLLVERHLAGRQTVIYVSDLKEMASEWGIALA